MNLQEVARLIQGLRALGIDADSINEFIFWMESGDGEHLPKKNQETKN
ncbi:MAG: hypothetical protein IKN43_02315 [Selenomonadaceae bacterium]|nr:hypothetical protein [Selenomonadaceae bacterium]